jgi:hypothetical protein
LHGLEELLMNILALEGLVEDGQIRLLDGVVLPDKTKVYVVVPAAPERTPRVWSPRLANPQDASQFRMEVTELPEAHSDAELRR